MLAFLLGSPETAALIGPETDPLYGHDGGAFLGDEQRMKERGPQARLEARLEAWSDLQRLAIQAKGHFGASIEAIAVQCQADWGKVQESPVASPTDCSSFGWCRARVWLDDRGRYCFRCAQERCEQALEALQEAETIWGSPEVCLHDNFLFRMFCELPR